jgi:cytochrome c
MSIWASRLAGAALLGAGTLAAAQPFPGIGRPATAAEVAAWDIDVRADFRGLPPGSGSVAKGQEVWEAKCASCHGIFGESNEVFSPIVGGTAKDDQRTGRVARLADPGFPQRTTLMKLSTVSTLWDYIRRAMPWTAPKTLTTEEVYATTAYVLNLGGIVPDDFVLSDRNIADVQARLPNRNGKTTEHGLWPGRTLGGPGRPDVRATACMNNCAGDVKVASSMPAHARNAHGNLADQNRLVGAQRGAQTAPVAAAAATDPAAAAQALARKHNCLTCHGIDVKVVGPGLREIVKKHAARSDLADYLAGRIVAGGSGVWGAIPMPAQTLPESDLKAIAAWLARGAP